LDLRKKWQKAGENYIMKSLKIYTLQQTLLVMLKSRRMKWTALVTHMGEVRNVCRILVSQMVKDPGRLGHARLLQKVPGIQQ
jgi:hypothetical protein